MIISRSADYGLRALIHLARLEDRRPEPLDRIAQTQRVPPALLSKILQTLVKAEILRSQKGYGGGFMLRVDPAELTLDTVIQTIDGPFTVFECLEDADFCELCTQCVMRTKFQALQDTLLGMMSATTIAELTQDGLTCLTGVAQ